MSGFSTVNRRHCDLSAGDIIIAVLVCPSLVPSTLLTAQTWSHNQGSVCDKRLPVLKTEAAPPGRTKGSRSPIGLVEQTRVYCPTYLIQGGALPLVSVHDIWRGVREAKKINGSLKVEFEGLRLLLQLTKRVELVVCLFCSCRTGHYIYVIKHILVRERKISYYL